MMKIITIVLITAITIIPTSAFSMDCSIFSEYAGSLATPPGSYLKDCSNCQLAPSTGNSYILSCDCTQQYCVTKTTPTGREQDCYSSCSGDGQTCFVQLTIKDCHTCKDIVWDVKKGVLKCTPGKK